jgi:glycosyltransferase involved in cell wall biosynthesis
MTTKVSVCLLTYNHEHLIAAVLDSILAQTYRDFELIVSDDCSTDGTWDLIRSIARKDPRVHPVRTPRNLGMAGNANFAVGLAAGDYIALVHHDDIVAPTLLEKWLKVAVESGSIGFVFNDYDVRGEASHATEGIRFDRRMDGKRFLCTHLLGRWGCPVRGTALINKSCFDAVGGMREEFSLLADIDLWMRLAARWDIGYVSEPLMRIGWTRPSDYPEDYTAFSWRRLRILFEIHATNFGAVAPSGPISRRFAWWMFRSRVSAEAAKWLVYAVVRRKRAMLIRAREGANEYEWWPVRTLRKVIADIGQAVFGIEDPVLDIEAANRRHGKREVK